MTNHREPSPRDDKMRAAYRALQSQRVRMDELQKALGSLKEPVAIVGIGCRFPGGVRGADSFWQQLNRGFDAVRTVPPDRWPVDDYYDPDPEARGKIYTRRGAFLDNIDCFDAAFFGISPREAAAMDPQQRLLLETAWDAMADAGILPAQLTGSATSVFVGITLVDYLRLSCGADLDRIEAHTATGNVANMAAGRLSYFFGLAGPAVAVDTSCSSSLVAVHLAAQSLRSGETTLALAAGVNAILSPESSVAVSRARMLSAKGVCRAFDAGADGYVRGEGCGVVVLKLLSRAEADGDRIIATIRGSAIAQDGARSGLTVPNGRAQAALIHRVLTESQTAPTEVGYIEAHGTGTFLGDPIEAEALKSVFGGDPGRTSPLVIGSLKTNVGHMESAAGIGGLIKAALCVRHGVIPRHLHFERENPELRLSEIPARIPVTTENWPSSGRRMAGVSSFGSCGTIAHVLLQEAPARAAAAHRVAPPWWLLLSAKTPRALRELASSMSEWLGAQADDEVADVCWTAAANRAHFECRLAVAGASAAELSAALLTASSLVPRSTAIADYLAGSTPDLKALFGDWKGRRVALPPYPFQRESHWAAVRRASAVEPPVEKTQGALDFGVMFFNGTEAGSSDRYRLLFETAKFADRNGFSTVWLPERHFTAFGALYPNPAVIHAALARETRRIRLMAGSCVLPLHDIFRVVEEWSIVDNMSGGRVGISFAPGWNASDFALAPERFQQRYEILFSGIPDAQRLWRGECVQRCNGEGRDVALRVYPTPVQSELPLWLTVARSERTFEIAGEIGANLLTHLLDHDVATLGGKLQRYRTALARSGHDPASKRVTVMLHTFVDADGAKVEAKARASYCRFLQDNIHLLAEHATGRGRTVDTSKLSPAERSELADFIYDRFVRERALIGTPASCAPLVRQLEAIGVDEIACLLDFGPAADDVAAMLPQLAAFKAEMQKARTAPAVTASPVVVSSARPALTEPYIELKWQPARTAPPSVAAQPSRWAVIGGGALGGVFTGALQRAGHDAAECRWDSLPSEPSVRLLNVQAVNGRVLIADHLAVMNRAARDVWTVTVGAQAADGVVPDAEGAALWGLARALAVERPTAWGGLIDLDPRNPVEEQVEAVVRVLAGEYQEDQLALRNGLWTCARLVQGSVPAAVTSLGDGPWLITGGLGGLGFGVTEWLIGKGARQILLLGRSAPSPKQKTVIETWRRAGARVETAAADCANAEAVAEALGTWRNSGGERFRGVFHLAGVWHDCLLCDLDAEAMDSVWRPKVGGAGVLERALADDPIEQWVYFSAFSAVLPAPGQGNYAAANSWLDANAHRHRANGVRAVSINWGPWSGIGFAETEHGRKAHRRLEDLGVRRFALAEGLPVMEQAITSAQPQIAVIGVDWRRFFDADPRAGASPVFAELARKHNVSPESSDAKDQLVRAFATAAPNQRLEVLTAEIRRIAAMIIRLEAGEIPTTTPLNQLGVDSLLALEIKNRLQLETGIEVPLVDLLRGPTIDHLAAKLLPRLNVAVVSLPAEGAVEEVEL